MPKKRKILISIRLLTRQYALVYYLLKWLFISNIIAICVGSASAIFLLSLDWITQYRESHLWLIALLPIAGLSVGLLYHYYGTEVEGGNNLLIENINNPTKIIPFRMAPFIYLGTLVTHLFGGSAGREGTALQMAGGIADQFTNVFKLNANERKSLLIASIAAGFGAVFGTPLAGAVFALEVFLIGKIRYHAIYPAFLSAIMAHWVCSLWQVPHTHYAIPLVPPISASSLLYSLLAGVCFGACAWGFSKAMHLSTSFFKHAITYPPLRPFVGGILVALGIWTMGTTEYIGLGIPSIVASFDHTLPLYAFVVKILFTLVTLSSGFKGGEVTPLFFIGATLGNALSLWIGLPMGLLAGMGFVAVFAGATNTPLACILMGLELFGVESGIYIALACLIAYLIAGHNSIYRNQILGIAKHPRLNNQEGRKLGEL